ncbi:sensor histidine kinase [Corynebacterium rhinophilum]|uniref:sensor histidine kinase n=1 Tax=Corynebacterium rhinophilum TaxID=3050197 RepID=UPI0025505AE7|nr:histidine kinase [Corynebacterium sp. MSK107]MDK8702740.1 histidine kinase [Corynebacterium sp. MSK107]
MTFTPPPPFRHRLRAAMTLQRTAALIAIICLALTLFAAFLTPTKHQLSAAIVGLILTAITTSAYRYPKTMAVGFLAIWIIAILTVGIPYASSVFLAPVFLAVFAFHSTKWQSILLCVVFWLVGLVDPSTLRLVLNPTPALVWGIFLVISTFIGSSLAHSARRYKTAMVEWNNDVKRRQSDLAETLHNSVISSLTVNIMQLEALSLEYASTPELSRRLDELSDAMRSSMSEIRALTKVLRSNIDGINDEFSFKQAARPTSLAQVLAWEEGQLSKLNRTPIINVSGEDFCPQFSPSVLDSVVAITREACLNAVKYSPPGAEITVSAQPHLGWTILTICNPIAKPTSTTPETSSGIGINSMTRLAATIDARFEAGQVDDHWELTLALPPSAHEQR